jgi:hypothetical protein
MGKGLLAWWRRRIVARGLAGAALLAVPVAVAALIGFGTSISGVAGGLSAVTSGPDATPVSSPTRATSLNHAVVALASKQSSAGSTTTGASNGDTSGGTTGIGGGGSSGSGTGSSGSGGGSSSPQVPTISSPSAPDVTLPGGSSTGGTSDTVNGTVNNVIGGVNDTVNGLLGQ